MGNPVLRPWVSIIGLGEDGAAGLSDASRAALAAAEIIFGGPRHLALVAAGDRGRDWPVPFSIDPVLACRGRRVAVLASGDPFWHGAGGSLAAQLDRAEWRAFPAPSTFQLAAARLGWRMEEITCHGLHAAPFARLRPVLTKGARAICLLRDGDAPKALAEWLLSQGFTAELVVLERLGGAQGYDESRNFSSFAGVFPANDPHYVIVVALDDTGAGETGGLVAAPVVARTLRRIAPMLGLRVEPAAPAR